MAALVRTGNYIGAIFFNTGLLLSGASMVVYTRTCGYCPYCWTMNALYYKDTVCTYVPISCE